MIFFVFGNLSEIPLLPFCCKFATAGAKREYLSTELIPVNIPFLGESHCVRLLQSAGVQLSWF